MPGFTHARPPEDYAVSARDTLVSPPLNTAFFLVRMKVPREEKQPIHWVSDHPRTDKSGEETETGGLAGVI